jgi:hypothetical protein
LLCLTALSALVVSCNKDKLSNPENSFSDAVKTRDASPMIYSVVDGRVTFPSSDAYHATLTYLNNATPGQIDSFRNSISIETVAKSYVAFNQSSCGLEKNASQNQILAIENLFINKINILIDSNGNRNYEPKFRIFPEITNLKGEYKIENTIIKQIGAKFISVTRPELVNLDTMSMRIKTDTIVGIHVVDNSKSNTRGDCCPRESFTETTWEDGCRRVLAIHRIENVTSFLRGAGGTVTTVPEILVTLQASNQFLSGVWPLRSWVCDQATTNKIRCAAVIRFTHNFTNYFPSPIAWGGDKEEKGKCNVFVSNNYKGPTLTGTAILPDLDICVERARVIGYNPVFSIKAEYSCDK